MGQLQRWLRRPPRHCCSLTGKGRDHFIDAGRYFIEYPAPRPTSCPTPSPLPSTMTKLSVVDSFAVFAYGTYTKIYPVVGSPGTGLEAEHRFDQVSAQAARPILPPTSRLQIHEHCYVPPRHSAQIANAACPVNAQWNPPLRVVLLPPVRSLLPCVSTPHEHAAIASLDG